MSVRLSFLVYKMWATVYSFMGLFFMIKRHNEQKTLRMSILTFKKLVTFLLCSTRDVIMDYFIK